MKRRTEITIKTDRLVILRHSRNIKRAAWCDACAAPTQLLNVDEAATLARSTSRAIYRRVEAAQLHFTETSEGRLLICLNSLS
ncbi:MAG: hypothetical protein ICV68_05525 [Pyrinomonadaceae bacterium]|nr:hypothetical protein [Pyrinomonadaceae bacterium]